MAEEKLIDAFKQFSSKERSVKKGEILQRPGETARRAFYVKKGLLRSYTIDEKGKEHIFIFAPEDWYISDIDADVHDVKAELFIDAIEDSEIEEFDRNLIDINDAKITIHDFKKLIKRVAVLQKRVIMLMSATAQERYEDFIKTYPSIVQRAPQKMIASYLGITPEALSKIRGIIARKK